jgi:hypothetical protein
VTNPSLFVGTAVRSSPDRLAYWYFRLNGFLTIENFAVHQEIGRNAGTDADVIAVRFRDRRENFLRPMVDDPRVTDCQSFANFVIAEVKTTRCQLNGPWTNPERENMQRVLRAMGCVPDAEITSASSVLYSGHDWIGENVSVRLFAIGNERNTDSGYADVNQIIWEEVIDFCMTRFQRYGPQKKQVSQWAPDGLLLRELAQNRNHKAIRRLFGLPKAMSDGEDD